jgi:hypothetical protein
MGKWEVENKGAEIEVLGDLRLGGPPTDDSIVDVQHTGASYMLESRVAQDGPG